MNDSETRYQMGGGSMRRTVYNASGQEVGQIIDGCMYAVPAGSAGGGPGTLVCSERIARELVAANPGTLTLSAGCYTQKDVEAMRRLPPEAVQEFCAELMMGMATRVEDFAARFAGGSAALRPARPGSAAGGKAAEG